MKGANVPLYFIGGNQGFLEMIKRQLFCIVVSYLALKICGSPDFLSGFKNPLLREICFSHIVTNRSKKMIHLW